MFASGNRRQDTGEVLRYAAHMSNSSSKKVRRGNAPHVPRDADVGGNSRRRGSSPGSGADANPRDEYYTEKDKPLVAGSRDARALHDRPPPTKGELGVGTAGDAARASKTGIHNKPVPPRGRL